MVDWSTESLTSEFVFVIRNKSGVQIFRNDEKAARQRALTKMYTLVVTMSNIFRIRFRTFYHRFELRHCSVCMHTYGGLAESRYDYYDTYLEYVIQQLINRPSRQSYQVLEFPTFVYRQCVTKDVSVK